MQGKTANPTVWVSFLHSATLIEVSQHVYQLAAFCQQHDTNTASALDYAGVDKPVIKAPEVHDCQ